MISMKNVIKNYFIMVQRKVRQGPIFFNKRFSPSHFPNFREDFLKEKNTSFISIFKKNKLTEMRKLCKKTPQ